MRMMLTLVPYDYDSAKLLNLQLKWENDPALKHLFNYFPNEEAAKAIVTAEELNNRWHQERKLPNVKRFVIEANGRIIGEVSFSLGHQCTDKNPKAAWIGIVIGESDAHAKGYGTLTMRKLEVEISASGAERIDLGVFEFNEPARRLYEKLEYKTKTVIPDFTWWNGRMWSDRRMYKLL